MRSIQALFNTPDDRNFVKKAINWALHNIGKRNNAPNGRSIAIAQEVQQIDSKSAVRYITSDALRERKSEAVQSRLSCKKINTIADAT